MRACRLLVSTSLALIVVVGGHDANADFCDCFITATAPAGVVVACPQGDGTQLGSSGLTVSVTLRDCVNAPWVGLSPDSIRLYSCSDLLSACGGGPAGVPASVPTDANGHTTIIGAFAAAGCDLGGVVVYAQYFYEGTTGGAGMSCWSSCLPIKVKSVDLTGDVLVDLADFAVLGAGYTSPPKPYNECVDYRAPYGTVDLNDFVAWAMHYQHAC
jgi:hypothetical protein